jgi:hypothetical protein
MQDLQKGILHQKCGLRIKCMGVLKIFVGVKAGLDRFLQGGQPCFLVKEVLSNLNYLLSSFKNYFIETKCDQK